MRIFLTGASGFVGAAMLRLALQAGHEVAAPVRSGSQAHRIERFEGMYQRLELDLGHSFRLAEALADFKPDAVVHSAWWGVANAARFDRAQIAANMDIACSLTEAAASAGAKIFIGIGSQGEYGAGVRMGEDQLPSPTSLYGAAKVAAFFLTRQLAMQAGMRHCWLRLFSTYGPDDNPEWLIPMLISEMLDGRRPRTTLGTQFWDWLHVDDVARAIMAVAQSHHADGVFNLGSGNAVTVRSVVERIRDLIDPELDLIFGEVPFRPDQVMYMQADISKLRADTDWQPQITIDEGLASTVSWYRNRRR